MANDNVIYKARGSYPFHEGGAVVGLPGKGLTTGVNILDVGEHPTDTIELARDRWGQVFIPVHLVYQTGSAFPSGTFTPVYNG